MIKNSSRIVPSKEYQDSLEGREHVVVIERHPKTSVKSLPLGQRQGGNPCFQYECLFFSFGDFL
jgi:hypothetical protein